jgi:ABC-2 type transport system ATP-binding protein
MQAEDLAIRVRGVEKGFVVRHGMRGLFAGDGRRKSVLHDVDLDVRRGELLGLLGPNGAGKTTLLKMMSTLTLADRGTIEIDGIDVKKQPTLVRRRIGICNSDERSFYFRLTARENLAFFGTLAGLRGRHLRDRIEVVLSQVSLEESIDRRFGEFSSGMRQRLTVARALLGDPEILFFDEPTRAIDPIHADELRRLIRERFVDLGGKTVILATNILEEAWSICDRIAVVSGGTIAAVGAPADLERKPARAPRYRIEFDGEEAELAGRLRAIPGCDAVTATRSEAGTMLMVDCVAEGALGDLMRATAGAGGRLRSFAVVEPPPIEIFKEIAAYGT